MSSDVNSALQQLRDVRLKLLHLHKALLESERLVYEQFHGRIQSSGEFFRLVIGHDWFSWLRPISQLIVQMDDVLHSKEPVSKETIDDLLHQTREMMQPAEVGNPLNRRYYYIIQRDPNIALMHGDLKKLLGKDEVA
jgi:hypothetical protein